ncbi:MAG: ribosome-binding factor A [Bdellovibrionales bacterium]
MADRSTRVQRVERELLESLSHFLLHELTTPLPCYVSITAVEASPDLRHARVFFRLVGKEKFTRECEEILAGLRGAFQKYVATEVKMKFCPVLKFEFGKVAQQDEIDVLLENLRKPKRFGDDV